MGLPASPGIVGGRWHHGAHHYIQTPGVPITATPPPPGLIDLKARYLEADADYERIHADFPSGEQIVALIRDGLAPVADEQAAASHEAFARRINLGKAIQAHPWWRTQTDRAAADRALTEAAQARLAAARSVPVG